MTSSQNRRVAVVGDDSLFTPLSYLPLDWELTKHANVTDLMDSLRADGSVDGVILGDRFAGRSLDDVLKHVARLLLNGIPCALVAYSAGTREEIESAWPKMEKAMRHTYDQMIQAREDAGEEIPDDQQVSPSDSTFFAVVESGGGAQHLMKSFGPRILNPFALYELSMLDDPRYAQPFPSPGDAGFVHEELSLGERKARIVTVASDKGGCGKTSLALMFGATVAYESLKAGRPKRVVVVDLDRQSQISAMFPQAQKSIMDLKPNSTSEQIDDVIHRPLPDLPNLGLVVGAPSSSDHRAMRTLDLYSHVVSVIASDLADLVVIDGSVGITDDPVTMWAQQNSYAVYYVLDQLSNSLALAVDAFSDSTRPQELGGAGLAPERFVLVENMVLDVNPEARKEFLSSLARRLPDVAIHGRIPHGGIRVHAAQQEMPEGGLLRLAINDEVLSGSLQEWAQKLYPELFYTPEIKGEFSADKKKRGLLR
jgi:cellulose biosynthesis protein BcsQ